MKSNELRDAYDGVHEELTRDDGSCCPRCHTSIEWREGGEKVGVCDSCAQDLVPLMLSVFLEVEIAFDEIDDAVSEFPCDGPDHERKVYESLARARDRIRAALDRLEGTEP